MYAAVSPIAAPTAASRPPCLQHQREHLARRGAEGEADGQLVAALRRA